MENKQLERVRKLPLWELLHMRKALETLELLNDEEETERLEAVRIAIREKRRVN